MIAIHRSKLYRGYYAPLFSGATVFFLLSHAATIIGAFLIAYFTHGFWVKEASYREQPRTHSCIMSPFYLTVSATSPCWMPIFREIFQQVAYTHACVVRLHGRRASTSTPLEIVYSTLPRVNDMAEEHVRIPAIRVAEQDINGDQIADSIKLDLEFPVDEAESITHVQGVFVFDYELRNRVRLKMDTPIMLDYGAGVAGSGLAVDGRMRLRAANPLAVAAAVRGADSEAMLPRDLRPGAADVSMQSLLAKALERNETTVLDPLFTSWKPALAGCRPRCSFTLSLMARIPNEKVLYVPTFVEICKFSWIQFITTLIFLRLFVKPLLNFIADHQIIQSIPRDPRKAEKLL